METTTNNAESKPLLVYTEMTPNPATCRFVLDRNLLPTGGVEFVNETEAKQSILAEKLFQRHFTKSIYIGTNFVTVTKHDDNKWEEVIPAVKEDIGNFVKSGEKVIENQELLDTTKQAMTELEQKIRQMIEDTVRPAVAMDGGDIIYESFEDGVVKLRLMGSCSGCPSSTYTLKNGIENLLKRFFPNDVKSVEAL